MATATKLQVEKFSLRIKTRISYLIAGLLISFPIFSQDDPLQLSFTNESAERILETTSEILGVTFNYNHEILPDQSFSFSTSGSKDECMKTVFSVIDRNFAALGQNIYAVQNLPMDEEKKQAPYLYKGMVQSNDGLPIAFCNIISNSIEMVYSSDANGHFEFKAYLGNYDSLQFSYLGYKDRWIKVGDLRIIGTLTLKPEPHILGEVIIKDFIPTTIASLNSEEIKVELTTPVGYGDNDILRSVAFLPGVNTGTESLSDLQIRGGPPDQTSFSWNGIKLYQSSLFYGNVGAVNPFMVDQLSVSKNGSSASDSDQASGSINMKSFAEKVDSNRWQIHTNMLNVGLGYADHFWDNKVNLKLGFRHSLSNLFSSPVFKNYFDQAFQFGTLFDDKYYVEAFDLQDQVEIEESFSFRDFSATLYIKPTEWSTFNLSHINYGNFFQYDYFDNFFAEQPLQEELRTANSGTSVEYIINPKPNGAIKVYHNRSSYRQDYVFDDDVTDPQSPLFRTLSNGVKQYRSGIESSYRWKFLEFKTGLSFENWDVDFHDTTRVAERGTLYVFEEKEASEWSGFGNITLLNWKNIRSELGIRVSDYNKSNGGRILYEPRFHLSYLLKDRITFHFHYGEFHQNLSRRNYFTPFQVERGIWTLSHEIPDDKPWVWIVQNRQVSAGVQYQDSYWKFNVDIYNKRADSIWTSALDFSVEEDPFLFATLRSTGLELSGQFRNEHQQLMAIYDYTAEGLSFSYSGMESIPNPYIQPHKVTLIYRYFWKHFSLAAQYKYGTGNRYSEGLRIGFNDFGGQDLFYSGLYNRKVDDYHRLDLSFNYVYTFQKFKRLNIGFQVLNAFNQQNIVKRQYYIDYTKIPNEMNVLNRRGIPFTPNISLTLDL